MFDPFDGGRGAVRGGCERCLLLVEICEMHQKMMALMRTFTPPPDKSERSGLRADRCSGSSAKMDEVKARVYVTFKQSVLDPQGQTIRAALNGLGHKGIEDVRQGKFFEITLDDGEDLDAIARDVLSNPVIEDYRIEKLS